MLESIRDLVLNHELYNVNKAAVMSTIVSVLVRTFLLLEEPNSINRQNFSIIEINFRNIYNGLGLHHSIVVNDQNIFIQQLKANLPFLIEFLKV
jgi:hypothetical protein